jgi:hypothetical protein
VAASDAQTAQWAQQTVGVDKLPEPPLKEYAAVRRSPPAAPLTGRRQ